MVDFIFLILSFSGSSIQVLGGKKLLEVTLREKFLYEFVEV